ncbi:MAG: hypothetical protein ABR573_06400 [Candidatus Dormibacteria bacterium]
MEAETDQTARPDIAAATRGGDPAHGLDQETMMASATLSEAVFWRGIYKELLDNERKVMDVVQDLMAHQSETARHEVELTNVPVIAAQAERFRLRMEHWEERIAELS